MQHGTTSPAPATFRELATRIHQVGLLKRRPWYYTLKIAGTVSALIAAWWALFFVGDSWNVLIVAAALGIVFTQLGFVGHDAGHLQVFSTRRANRLLGMGVGNALIGVSFGWWVPKHSAHHAFPNHVDRDPDLAPGFVTLEGGADESGGPAHRNGYSQAALFFPLMLLRSTGLHVLGIRRLLHNRDRDAAIEGALIALHAAAYLAMVLLVLSPMKAFVFIIVQQAVFSVYLGCSFAPNHKGMPVVRGDAEMDFASRQVLVSRNVRGGSLTTFCLGGLNYQIEHHLFPSMPRPNLARAQALVRSFCLESGLGYCEDTFVGSMRQALTAMPLLAVAREPALTA